MKNKNLSWFAALLVFALLLWCTAATPGKIADPSTYTCAVYSTIFSLLPPVIAIVLALNTKEVYTSLLVGIASGALLYANGNLELAINTLFFNEDGGMVAKLVGQQQRGHFGVPCHAGHPCGPDEQGRRLGSLSAAGPPPTSTPGPVRSLPPCCWA